MIVLRQARLWWRQIFVAYALLLFVATHWPQLRISGPPIRSDLIMHVVAFGTWAFLFAAAHWIGNWNSWRGLSWPLAISIVYAAIDEGLQAIPALGRTCAWDDFAANCGGVVLGIASARLAREWVNRRRNI